MTTQHANPMRLLQMTHHDDIPSLPTDLTERELDDILETLDHELEHHTPPTSNHTTEGAP